MCPVFQIFLVVLSEFMALRTARKTTFEVEKVIEPIYSGGSVALDYDGRILATCLAEDVLLTDLANGKRLARIEGVSFYVLRFEIASTKSD